jgi:CubicO group peptidase (beta-lactamase class C family)
LEIHGTVAPGFEPVRETFEENFRRRGEIGAALCVERGGERVVDLWGGRAAPGRAWNDRTLVPLFSATKGLVALCFLLLHDRREIDLDAPIAEIWSGFARHGKEAITLRDHLNHRSGLYAVERPLTLDDLKDRAKRVEAVEEQAPFWARGEAQAYGAVTFGLVLGEVFERVRGESLGTFFEREVARPLGGEVYLGLPSSEHSRVARVEAPRGLRYRLDVLQHCLRPGSPDGRLYRNAMRARSETRLALANPAQLGRKHLGNYNLPEVWEMEIPWSGAIGSGRGLARVYAALASGGRLGEVRLLSPATAALPGSRGSWGFDRVLRKPIGYTLGFVKEEEHLFSPNPESFGHPGAGGALGYADPRTGFSIGYAMNRMDHHLRSSRALALTASLYRCRA